MTRRPEYVEAIRALGGSTGDPTPVIRLLRDPSGLPAEDWRELVALIAELLSGDNPENPLVLRVHRADGKKGRLPAGQGTEETRLRWVAGLSKSEPRTLNEIADALEGVGRYRLTLERRGAGNIEKPEAGLPSTVLGEELHRQTRNLKGHGAFKRYLRRMAAELHMSERTMYYHWRVYHGSLSAAREELLRILARKK